LGHGGGGILSVTSTVAAATRPALVAERSGVATGHPTSAEIGAEVLRRDGNAVDAAVAAAFASFVVEPASCGVAGHGRMSIHLARRGKTIGIDHFIRAPRRATPDMYRQALARRRGAGGGVDGAINTTGHLSVGVPGAIAGLWEAHRRFGRRPWRELVRPAIDLAEAGWPMDWRVVVQIANRAAEIRNYAEIEAWLMPDGAPPPPATWSAPDRRLATADLAKTLRRIADDGIDGFYDGPVARAIAADMEDRGGLLAADDLAAYRPDVFEQPRHRYRRWAYVTCGDLTGALALNVLEKFDIGGLGHESVGYRHLMAEALARTFVENFAHAGDPRHTAAPLDGLADKGYAAGIAAGIQMDRATAAVVPGDPWPFQSRSGPAAGAAPPPPFEGTTQICTADAEGNMVALITSLGSAFGSLVLVPETGVVLGNAMQWFDPRPGRTNSVGPGRMPLYAAPVMLVFDGDRAVGAFGGSGGYRITTAILHSFVNVVDHGMGLQAAIEAPRVHHQGDGLVVDRRIAGPIVDGLVRLGHRLETIDTFSPFGGLGRPSAIWRKAPGHLELGSDPMSGGTAGT
jgi:gamma-glutamyltranspeptidase/glutathione hydrolase